MKVEIDVCTLFPQLVRPFLEEGIVGKAAARGLVRLGVCNIRDHAPGPHHVADDAPYGGGGGMVLKPDPVVVCVKSLPAWSESSRAIVLAARGKSWTDQKAREAARTGGHLVLICGRYEGIDQRAIEILGAEEISIGDFVVTGGESAAVAVLESIVRLVPGATGDESAQESDSFRDGLLEHPHYTRPAEFGGLGVPEDLLSGDHARVAHWRRRESLAHTWRVRPDLLDQALAQGRLTEDDLALLAELGHPSGKEKPRKRRRKARP